MPFHEDNGGSHHDRPDLAGEYIHGDMGQLVLLFVFIAVWALDSFHLGYTLIPAALFPLWVRGPLAAALIIIALWLARAGLNMVFGEVRKEPHVITRGVFSIVRHPVYLGAILIYAGFVALTLSLLSLIVWLVIVGFYFVISRLEEAILLRRFGREYTKYQERVPMLFPLPHRRSSRS